MTGKVGRLALLAGEATAAARTASVVMQVLKQQQKVVLGHDGADWASATANNGELAGETFTGHKAARLNAALQDIFGVQAKEIQTKSTCASLPRCWVKPTDVGSATHFVSCDWDVSFTDLVGTRAPLSNVQIPF